MVVPYVFFGGVVPIFSSRGLKPLNCDSDILQLDEDVFGFDVVEVYMD